MAIKKKLIFLALILILIPLVLAGNYGEGVYGVDNYGIGGGESTPISTPIASTAGTNSPRGGTKGSITETEWKCYNNEDCNENEYCFENKCFKAECFSDEVCKEDEKCWNYRCVKLFDAEIKDFESPVKLGEFFDFTYLIKGMANIDNDVEVKFWIEKDNVKITSGQDTIYLGSFEEKVKTTKLFLPKNIESGTYIFRFEVSYEKYTAKSFRTIEIEINEGMATIYAVDNYNYVISILIGAATFILFLVFYLERKKIKEGIIKEEKWFKKHKVSVLLLILFIILGILIYYFEWYKLFNIVPYLRFYKYFILSIVFVFILIIELVILRKRFRRKKKKGNFYRKRIRKKLEKYKK